MARLGKPMDVVQNFRTVLHHPNVGGHRKTPRLQDVIDPTLRRHWRVIPRPHTVNGHGQSAEALRHQRALGVTLTLTFLPQASGSSIPRVSKNFVARLSLCPIQLLERLEGEKHFTANLHQFGVTGARERPRDGGHQDCVLRDVFTGDAITTGGGADKLAALIAEVDG